MRIVGGEFKGRRLTAPEGRDVRPTSDRVRESVFNVLEHSRFSPGIRDASVIDIFAGTGALGLEALSRGARAVTFVEHDDRSRAAILKNAGTLGKARAIHVFRLDATKLPPPPRAAHCPATLAFLDAPYDQDISEPTLLSLQGRGWINEDTLCIVETPSKSEFAAPRGFEILDQRKYGAAMISFLKIADSSAVSSTTTE
jgi:16S rRNA (guanine966-N2)-methyltransferase